jgi:hypothetical protein
VFAETAPLPPDCVGYESWWGTQIGQTSFSFQERSVKMSEAMKINWREKAEEVFALALRLRDDQKKKLCSSLLPALHLSPDA